MATTVPSTFLPRPCPRFDLRRCSSSHLPPRRPKAFRVRAAKLPAGVEVPKVEPKLTEAFLGFTKTAEIWNSRACMIGIISIFIVELIAHKGLLQMIGLLSRTCAFAPPLHPQTMAARRRSPAFLSYSTSNPGPQSPPAQPWRHTLWWPRSQDRVQGPVQGRRRWPVRRDGSSVGAQI